VVGIDVQYCTISKKEGAKYKLLWPALIASINLFASQLHRPRPLRIPWAVVSFGISPLSKRFARDQLLK